MDTVGFSCGATFAPVPDHKVGEEGPVFLRHNLDEGRLNFYGIILAGKAHPSGKTADMGVDNDAFRKIEGVPQNHISCLATYTGQPVQLLHRVGNFALVVGHQGGSTTANGTGLGPVKSGGSDDSFEFGLGNRSKIG